MEKIKERLDEFIALRSRLIQIKEFGGVKMCSPEDSEEVHVLRGIESIAQELGLPITESVSESGDYPYKYFLEYNGVQLFQIENERLDLSGVDTQYAHE